MCAGLTWKQKRNKKVQATFDAAQKRKKSHLVRAICDVVYDYDADDGWPPEGMIDELVEIIMKLDESK